MTGNVTNAEGKMVLDTGKKRYKVVSEALGGGANDIYVCQDQKEPTAPYKTVWLVRDRRVAKELLGCFGDVCEECFMHNETAGFVLGYDGERPLDRFYQNAVQGGSVRASQIWLELVVRCMTSGLPPAVLNMILKQRQIHIGADGSVWFGYFLDLSGYDAQAGEKENVELCAAYIVQLIESGLALKTDAARNIRVMNLIQKKLNRRKYREFIQLYSDIRLMTKESGPDGKKERLKSVVISRQDAVYKILSILCIVLVCIVIVLLVGRLVYGEFSFWRLFQDSFEQIGTESLLQ